MRCSNNRESKADTRICMLAQKACTLIVTLCLGAGSASAASDYTPLNRYPHMVQEYFVSQLGTVERKANLRRDALKSRDDAKAYVDDAKSWN